MKYSFDTSAFLNPWNRDYPPDIFGSLWEGFDDLIQSGRLLATEEVLEELRRKDDEMYRWALDRRQMFVPLHGLIQQAVIGILAEYPRLIDNRRNRSGADPFVIALAQVEDCTVVTCETRTNSLIRPHIPDVCDALNIRCIDVVGLIREQGWNF